MHQKPPLGIQVDWSNPITKGLVGCWLFNEGGGDKVYDLSGHGNTGTLTGMAFPSTIASGWNPGKDGSAIAFDGSNDYIDCGNNASLRTTSSMSIYILCYPRDVNDYEVQISKIDNAWSDNGEWMIEFGSGGDGYLRAYFYDGTNNSDMSVSGYTSKSWYSIGVTNQYGVSAELFVNGSSVATGTGLNLRGANSSVRIGCRFVSNTQNSLANTIISVAMIWSRALSPQEIQQLYINPYGMFKRLDISLLNAMIETAPSVFIPWVTML